MGKQFIFAKGTASFKMGLVTAGVIRSQNRALWHLSSLAESGRDRATEESAYGSSNFCMQPTVQQSRFAPLLSRG